MGVRDCGAEVKVVRGVLDVGGADDVEDVHGVVAEEDEGEDEVKDEV